MSFPDIEKEKRKIDSTIFLLLQANKKDKETVNLEIASPSLITFESPRTIRNPIPPTLANTRDPKESKS